MYELVCESCGKKIKYKNIYTYKQALKNDVDKCLSCVRKKYHSKFKDIEHPLSKKMSGENNPFYGKTHSEESIKKIQKNRDKSFQNSKEYKEKMSALSSGKNNPMYGKKVFDIWVDKYGIAEANKKELKRKKKLSKAMSGKNNPMYGKPSPKGSGSGRSGWYNNIFF